MVYIGRLRRLLLAASLASALACQQLPTEDPTTTADAATDTDGSDSEDPSAGSGPTQDQSLPDYRCDPADLSTCGADEKCTALLQGSQQNLYDCVPKDSLYGLYDACSPAPENGQDACSPGTICAPDSSERSTGLCVPLCVNDSDCADGRCIENVFNDVPICADSCDPQVPLCPTGLECRQTDDSFACQFPTEVDIGQETAQCLVEGDRGCSQGYVCEAGELIPNCASPTGFCCTPICDTNNVDTCESPATCNPAFINPAPGYEWVGACFVPS